MDLTILPGKGIRQPRRKLGALQCARDEVIAAALGKRRPVLLLRQLDLLLEQCHYNTVFNEAVIAGQNKGGSIELVAHEQSRGIGLNDGLDDVRWGILLDGIVKRRVDMVAVGRRCNCRRRTIAGMLFRAARRRQGGGDGLVRMRYDAITNCLPVSWSDAKESLERETVALTEAVAVMNGI